MQCSFTLILYNLLLAICCCVKDNIISTKFVCILMYHNQGGYKHHTPSFPIGLVKTESGFIVRSVETGLGR